MELLYGDEVVAEVTEIQPVKPEFEKACEKLAESMGAIRLRQMPIANNQHATMPGTGIRIHAGVPMTSECIGDATGKRRIRKLRDRVKHIDEQIAELQDKKEIML
ncbi:MAG: hypothetical protein ABFC78_04855, partial [Methanoregula sp.]